MTDQQTSTFSLYEEVRARPVDSDDCWLYAGKMNAYGYGFITSGRKLRAMAHRAMYEQSSVQSRRVFSSTIYAGLHNA